MHWLLGAAVCRLLREHKPTLWSDSPQGVIVFCLRCSKVLERY